MSWLASFLEIELSMVRNEEVKGSLALAISRLWVYTRPAEISLVEKLGAQHMLIVVELEDYVQVVIHVSSSGQTAKPEARNEADFRPFVLFTPLVSNYVAESQLVVTREVSRQSLILADVVHWSLKYCKLFPVYNLLTTNCQFFCYKMLTDCFHEDSAARKEESGSTANGNRQIIGNPEVSILLKASGPSLIDSRYIVFSSCSYQSVCFLVKIQQDDCLLFVIFISSLQLFYMYFVEKNISKTQNKKYRCNCIIRRLTALSFIFSFISKQIQSLRIVEKVQFKTKENSSPQSMQNSNLLRHASIKTQLEILHSSQNTNKSMQTLHPTISIVSAVQMQNKLDLQKKIIYQARQQSLNDLTKRLAVNTQQDSQQISKASALNSHKQCQKLFDNFSFVKLVIVSFVFVFIFVFLSKLDYSAWRDSVPFIQHQSNVQQSEIYIPHYANTTSKFDRRMEDLSPLFMSSELTQLINQNFWVFSKQCSNSLKESNNITIRSGKQIQKRRQQES
ncbi:hypothetical protein ABPG72_005359 [Tetrahymena utriculariae]